MFYSITIHVTTLLKFIFAEVSILQGMKIFFSKLPILVKRHHPLFAWFTFDRNVNFWEIEMLRRVIIKLLKKCLDTCSNFSASSLYFFLSSMWCTYRIGIKWRLITAESREISSHCLCWIWCTVHGEWWASSNTTR